MSAFSELAEALEDIDRPGDFCTSGVLPCILPGIEIKGHGTIGLPISVAQANELKKLAEQAPYGKGEKTLVDTNVRRVWRLTPDRFTITNPAWDKWVEQVTAIVKTDLGLENQTLEAHLYDLLLYEKDSFFLPHQDGQKLPRMVATLVIILPSNYTGGELVVRHENTTVTVDCGPENSFQTCFASFYADCEHEVKPLTSGHRVCLIYNLTLEKGAKTTITAPPKTAQFAAVADALRSNLAKLGDGKLVVTLSHQYTKDGLKFDVLKGVDRIQAEALFEGARQAGCCAHLAMLTYHQSGSAEYSGFNDRYSRRGRYYDGGSDNADDYEMGEVFDTTLSLDNWSDREGNPLKFGDMSVKKEELLDPECLEEIEPEKDFEGYTGNAGMTVDLWYRHAAVVLWSEKQHYDRLAKLGPRQAASALVAAVKGWEQAGKKKETGEENRKFAVAILNRWPAHASSYFHRSGGEEIDFLDLFDRMDDVELSRRYLAEVLPKDASANASATLPRLLEKHGWKTFHDAFVAIGENTTAESLDRNIQMLEQLAQAQSKKSKGSKELCQAFADGILKAITSLDSATSTAFSMDRRVAKVVPLVRALHLAELSPQMLQFAEHMLKHPELYPLRSLHLPVLKKLAEWLSKNVKKKSAGLELWIAGCRAGLEKLAAAQPKAPADHRRTTLISCTCAVCKGINAFLASPTESVYRQQGKPERKHAEDKISDARCDLDLRTDTTTKPQTLVCTKNIASHHRAVEQWKSDCEELKFVQGIEAALPKR